MDKAYGKKPVLSSQQRTKKEEKPEVVLKKLAFFYQYASHYQDTGFLQSIAR